MMMAAVSSHTKIEREFDDNGCEWEVIYSDISDVAYGIPEWVESGRTKVSCPPALIDSDPDQDDDEQSEDDPCPGLRGRRDQIRAAMDRTSANLGATVAQLNQSVTNYSNPLATPSAVATTMRPVQIANSMVGASNGLANALTAGGAPTALATAGMVGPYVAVLSAGANFGSGFQSLQNGNTAQGLAQVGQGMVGGVLATANIGNQFSPGMYQMGRINPIVRAASMLALAFTAWTNVIYNGNDIDSSVGTLNAVGDHQSNLIGQYRDIVNQLSQSGCN